MKRLTFFAVLAAIVAFVAVTPVQAYYDDVHYALTYYIARQIGYTPLQAKRIADVTVSTDYDPDTEPVQPTGQKFQLVGIKSKAQTPRWKFHAFVNELLPPSERMGSGIRAQREALWEHAKVFLHRGSPNIGGIVDPGSYGGNPGVFLHFLQDEEPHAGYGSAWGHWPLDPTVFPNTPNPARPVGGTTDWIAFRTSDVGMAVEQTASWLGRFMQHIAPKQELRPFDAAEFRQIVNELAYGRTSLEKEVARSPDTIESELERQMYARFFGMDPFMPAQPSAADIADMAAQLKGKQSADFHKHKGGPNVVQAVSVVNDALGRAGMPDRLGTDIYQYDLDQAGGLTGDADDAMIDKWVLAGTVRVKVVEWADKGDRPLKSGNVALWLAKTRRDGKDQRLQVLPIVTPGAALVFENTPVGDLFVEVIAPDGTQLEKVAVTLNKREHDMTVTVLEVSPQGAGTWSRGEAIVRGSDVNPAIPPGFTGSASGVSFSGMTDNKAVSNSVTWKEPPPGMSPGDKIQLNIKSGDNLGPGSQALASIAEFRYCIAGAAKAWGTGAGPNGQSTGADIEFVFEPNQMVINRGKCTFSIRVTAQSGPQSGKGVVVAWDYTPSKAPRAPRPTPAPPPPAPPPTQPAAAPPAPAATPPVAAPPVTPAATPPAQTTPKPPAPTVPTGRCAEIKTKRDVLTADIARVKQQIAETTVPARAESLKRRLAELQAEDETLRKEQAAAGCALSEPEAR